MKQDPRTTLATKLQTLIDVYAGLEIEKIISDPVNPGAFIVEMETAEGIRQLRVTVETISPEPEGKPGRKKKK